jgi:hypothetical protein
MKKLQYNLQVLGSVFSTAIQFIACIALLLPMALLPTSARKALDATFSTPDNSWY